MKSFKRLTNVFGEEFGGISVRRIMCQGLIRCLPVDSFGRLRTRLYRLAGAHIGKHTTISGTLRLTGGRHAAERLKIGHSCYLNEGIYFNLGADVSIDHDVSIGMQCLFITASHEIQQAGRRAGPNVFSPISVGAGSWIAARVTVLPGVSIGQGSVIGAGAVVNKDIPDNVLAAGTPCKIIKTLSEDT